jgi:hypothetical protein
LLFKDKVEGEKVLEGHNFLVFVDLAELVLLQLLSDCLLGGRRSLFGIAQDLFGLFRGK